MTYYSICRVDQQGGIQLVGAIHVLAGDRYAIESSGQGSASTILDHLPWYIQDMRPEGYVGRALAHALHIEIGLPDNPVYWSDRQLLHALSLYGEDVPGNLILGDRALQRRIARMDTCLEHATAPDERARVYPLLAKHALAGGVPGSSAGGEQPKFPTIVAGADQETHMLVKFSPPTNTEIGRRQGELLICEHLALETLRRHGIPAARTEIIEGDGRVFLESERFDRIGLHGRLSLVSLAALDDEFRGRRDNWSAAATDLGRVGMLGEYDQRTIRLLDLFGRMIANTDRHFGNLSLHLADGSLFAPRRFALAPVYDMLPAAFAPAYGEIPDVNPDLPEPTADTNDIWGTAATIARAFWDRAANDERLSAHWREIGVKMLDSRNL